MSVQLSPAFFPSMDTMSSPTSPTLTHASSAPDGMDFFDFEAFESSNLNDNIVTDSNMFGDNKALQDLYAQYFGTSGDKVPFATAASAFEETAINPLLLDVTPPSQQATSTPESDMDEDEMQDGDYQEAPVKATKKAPAKKATRATASKAQPKRKAKQTVADLALPLDAPATLTVPKEKDAQGHLPHIVFPVPDYMDRPPPEEYAKLSSKEKRQLRNKISARNFRHRRKEYITTLEGELSERDSTISGLQEEVISLKTENKSLRSDLDLLKKTVDELLNKSRVADPAPEIKFNPRKDSALTSTSGLPWTSTTSQINVHTTLIPSFTSAHPLHSSKNINPLMQDVTSKDLFHLPGQQEDSTFLGGNPFTLNSQSMDRYRAQLYSNLTHNLNGQKQPTSSGFRPSFFTSSSAEMDQQVKLAAHSQTAFVAQEAVSTLTKGLFQSFWKTFTGSNPHQLTDLLAGRAEFKVVSTSSGASVEELDRSMAGLNVSSQPQASRTGGLTLFGARKS